MIESFRGYTRYGAALGAAVTTGLSPPVALFTGVFKAVVGTVSKGCGLSRRRLMSYVFAPPNAGKVCNAISNKTEIKAAGNWWLEFMDKNLCKDYMKFLQAPAKNLRLVAVGVYGNQMSAPGRFC
jgi:hypothetical protein